MKPLALTLTFLAFLWISSCTIDGEAGLGKIYIHNNTSQNLRIEVIYPTTENNMCASCLCESGHSAIVASLGDIGASPSMRHMVNKISIYRNDSLKIESVVPFSNLNVITSKGQKKYDTNYNISLSDADID